MKITINEKRTILNQGMAFSNKEKVISELIQNARRAGATDLQISSGEDSEKRPFIKITDNGSGISDFNSLFILSESNWDSETEQQEQPFGMGFFSVFFAGEFTTIESRGLKLYINNASALQMDEFDEPTPCDTSPKIGTAITLHNFNLPDLKSVLNKMAKYSSLNIQFNGVLLDSPCRFEALAAQFPVVNLSLGKMVIRAPFCEKFKVVAQEMLVNNEYSGRGNFFNYMQSINYNLFFADSASVALRMPDRDTLIDEKSVFNQIVLEMSAYFKDLLNTIRKEMNNDILFVDQYFDDIRTFSIALLNEIDYLPSKAFEACNYPTRRTDDFAQEELNINDVNAVSRNFDGFLLDENLHIENNCPLLCTFFHYAQALVLTCELHPDHWIHEKLISVKKGDVAVRLSNTQPFLFTNVDGSESQGYLVDNIQLTHLESGKQIYAITPDGIALFSGLAMHGMQEYTEDEQQLVLSNLISNTVFCRGVNSIADTLTQLNSYCEDESFYHDELTENEDHIMLQLRALRNESISDILKEFVGTLPKSMAEQLEGRTLTVTFINGQAVFSVPK